MPITRTDLRAILDLIESDPEERRRFAMTVLEEPTTAVILRLPAIVEALTEAQRLTETQVAALATAQLNTETQLAALSAAQRSSEDRLSRVESAVDRVDARLERLVGTQEAHRERLDRIDANIERLVATQDAHRERLDRIDANIERLVATHREHNARLDRLDAIVERLAEKLDRLTDVVGEMRGDLLLVRYRDGRGAYFGPLLRHLDVVTHSSLDDEVEAQLSRDEFDDVLRLDLVLTGVPRRIEGASAVWLAVEVSSVIDRTDVERADRRAALLRRAGRPAVPVVAGDRVTAGAEELAATRHVAMVLDGSARLWAEALAALPGP